MQDTKDLFWKKKLRTFLHDPPSKCLNIAIHEEVARQCMRSIGFSEEDWKDKASQQSDILAASADRFPFPKPVSSKFDLSDKNPFHHPFCNSTYAAELPLNPDLAEKKLQSAIYIVDENLSWKQRFFLYWRRWAEEASKSDSRLAFLPADSRIPDHTIWNHMSMASAFRTCLEDDGTEKTAFLLFQIGPVQEFIEQARSTRDCWSGSYLLSYLMSKALAVIAEEIGPDNIIFPSLRNQAFLDLAMREIYESIHLEKNRTLRDCLLENSLEEKLNVPTLPNRAFVLVPEDCAEMLVQKAEDAIRGEWGKIADWVWGQFSDECAGEDIRPWHSLWKTQVESFLKFFSQIMPWDSSLTNESLEKLCSQIPENQRDPRYFSDVSASRLSSRGYTWSRQYRRLEKAFSGRKALRDFEQYAFPPIVGKGLPQDMLSGKEECIGPESLWRNCGKLKHFKENEGPYGAICIIKRFFPDYIQQRYGLAIIPRQIPSTQEIAGDRGYFAVIALDGDAIGKRLSGETAKALTDLFSPESRAFFASHPEILHLKRDLTPSGHIQFSECLSNFALNLVKPVLDAFDGFLIYAGGDDVLGMVPAKNALKVGMALRMMFRGEFSPLLPRTLFRDFEFHNGWVFRNGIPLMVPGTDCEVSCGIAVAHGKYPLQRTIREARLAEHRAKTEFGRAAFAVSLLKRGGEIIHWGGKWNSPAIELFYAFQEALEKGDVGNRFAYTLMQTLQPYQLEALDEDSISTPDLEKILAMDFQNIAARQWLKNRPDSLVLAYLRSLRDGYLPEGEKSKAAFADFAKLFLSVTFIHRKVSEEE